MFRNGSKNPKTQTTTPTNLQIRWKNILFSIDILISALMAHRIPVMEKRTVKAPPATIIIPLKRDVAKLDPMIDLVNKMTKGYKNWENKIFQPEIEGLEKKLNSI